MTVILEISGHFGNHAKKSFLALLACQPTLINKPTNRFTQIIYEITFRIFHFESLSKLHNSGPKPMLAQESWLHGRENLNFGQEQSVDICTNGTNTFYPKRVDFEDFV